MSAALDPRQPVLVGVGASTQREDDFRLALEPLDLMLDAVRRAGADTGHAIAALAGVEHIAVPRGRWRYANPAGEIARAIGASHATTVLAGVGVLQQSLIGEACARIAGGEIESALVTGADTGFRILRARQAGERAAERQQPDAPDITLEPAEELLHPAELAAGIRMPVALYAILESAWRARHGIDVGTHRDQLGGMYQRFSEIAAANPDAWQRKPLSACDISEPSQRNPMQAFPYTRHHCASWNVDQASALLLCSVQRAQALGVDSSKWVYPLASTESGHMVPVSARDELWRCVGAQTAGHAALDISGLSVDALDWVELYNCFPVAVETYADALGLSLERDVSVTGGMSFAGGPFNNYVLQATCRMATLIRSRPASSGLVSSVSGILTKQGFGVWSGSCGQGFGRAGLDAETAKLQGVKNVLDGFTGLGRVAGYTVLHQAGHAPRALVLADTASGDRVLALSEETGVVERLQSDEFCSAPVSITGQTFMPA